MHTDPQKALHYAVKLAKKAGKIQMKRLGEKHHIEYKGEINIVTEVDHACEELIVNGLKKAFPHHDILAEEGRGGGSSSEYRWIVDPLDGTVNYAHGFLAFCVSIALEIRGELVVGVIYDPTRDECFTAIKGKGAYLNKKRIQVSPVSKLRQALLATGFAYNIYEKEVMDNFNHFQNFIKTAQAVRRPGSAALDLAWVASGRLDGFWEFFLKPWDMAAGVLIVREAGGTVTSFDGSAFDLYGTRILASNGFIHDDMRGILSGDRSQ
ncbi:MAG: inositol monophosphatase [Deltaproteobacteria bacterium RIFCSPLOWO2_02_FULL_44_10]|nr:MAG: inositol monophosphatase [Deltaproteobacteria bacterium RIFCSPHIGHO2_02_FULL_44_16]OGQ46712.1 MAG: inositol monophosphatase [Deltaproteobacteria bacterium RIFCSPLOWO2_02_FULL_44_10]